MSGCKTGQVKPEPETIVETKYVYVYPEDRWLSREPIPEKEGSSYRNGLLLAVKLKEALLTCDAKLEAIGSWKQIKLLEHSPNWSPTPRPQ